MPLPGSIRNCLIPVALLLNFTAAAQGISRYNTFSYNVNEGLLQSTIADIEYDSNNFLWISFPNGIQKFDGNTFTTISPQAGLPEDKNVVFFRSRNGDLFISHPKGITRYDIRNNRFTLLYEQPPSYTHAPIFVGEDEGVLYSYDQEGNMNGIDTRLLKNVSTSKTGFPGFDNTIQNRPGFSEEVLNHKTVFWFGTTLYLWDLHEQKIVARSEALSNRSPFSLKMLSENEVLYSDYTYVEGLKIWNFATRSNKTLSIPGKEAGYASRYVVYPWRGKMLLSLNNLLYETDSSLQVLKSRLVNFQNQPLSNNAGIVKIREDKFGNLAIQTVNGGIRKLIRNSYPIRYYSTERAEEWHAISVFADKKNNRVFAGTAGNGLMIFDTLQRFVRHIQYLPGETKKSFIVGAIEQHPSGDYLLFVASEKRVWRLSQDLASLRPLPLRSGAGQPVSGIDYFGNRVYRDANELVVQSQGKFFTMNTRDGIPYEHILFEPDVLSGIRYREHIIVHKGNNLVILDASTFREKERIRFDSTGGVRCYTSDREGNLYIGTNQGVFKTDSAFRVLYHLSKQNGMPDNCVYAMTVDDEGYLWCSTNKGLLKINKDKKILQLRKEDGLQENEFNTNAVFKAPDGEIFFAGVRGISSFYPSSIRGFEENADILITGIKVNNEDAFADTAIWNIRSLELPYNRNSLSFDFIAIADNNPRQYVYQYMMEGIDKQWIQNADLQTVRYHLQPGTYVFKVYASRQFDKDAKPMKEIHIIIHPPFWKTWWFLTGVGLLSLLLIAYIVNRYNQRRYEKKLAELESEKKVQLERERISRDLHDSIGAYANAVLYNTELLEKENDPTERYGLMSDLRFASKEIITSLRETIWALKKSNYTAEDCLIRVKNFIKTLSNHYQAIRFLTEGEAPPGKELHYTHALNLVRIVQEAVTNAIKHGNASWIKISSLQTADHWVLEIVNDGNGFDHAAVNHSGEGNGIQNMKQRAADSGFTIRIEPVAGGGTRVWLLV
ncbi:MAG TPA: triple tyrosine motif-containing protein [Ferruginibacter sp.]|nr:triple tyrosine motif-containing protein [Ferruginibacter sp.]